MLRPHALTLLLLVACVGAAPATAPRDPAPTHPQATAPAPTASAAPPPEDADEGYPSIEAPWTAATYTKVAALLSAREADGKPLPKLASPRGAAFFAHLTDRANLDALGARTLPLAERADNVQRVSAALGAATRAYVQKLLRSEPFGAELLELVAFSTDTSVATWAVLEDLVPTFDPKEPSYATRVQGLEQVRRGTREVVDGSLQMIRENDSPIVARFVEHVIDTLPKLLTHLPLEGRGKVLDATHALLTSQKDPTVVPLVRRLDAAMRAAATSKPPRP